MQPASPASMALHGMHSCVGTRACQKNRMGSARSAPMDLHGLRPCVGMWWPEEQDAHYTSGTSGTARPAFLREHGAARRTGCPLHVWHQRICTACAPAWAREPARRTGWAPHIQLLQNCTACVPAWARKPARRSGCTPYVWHTVTALPAPLPEHGSLPKNPMPPARPASAELHGLRPCLSTGACQRPGCPSTSRI